MRKRTLLFNNYCNTNFTLLIDKLILFIVSPYSQWNFVVGVKCKDDVQSSKVKNIK